MDKFDINVILILINLCQLITSQSNDCNTIVRIGHLSYMGCTQQIPTTSLSDSEKDFKLINSFKGIPYAVPPIGELRFRKPEPISYTNSVLINATKFGKSCLQPPIIDWDDNPLNFEDSSEDCLFLNIFTPTLRRSALLPVMFYIHGGAYRTDSSRDYPGEQLALRDVIVVTINYRLGVFGFLCTDRADAPGNMGLWDQALAMDWIKHNIRYFGGNSNDMTLFGQSYGAHSVGIHMVSKITQKYFKKVILMSDVAALPASDINFGIQVATNISTQLGCNGLNIECLRSKSGYDLLIAQSELDNIIKNSVIVNCIDNDFLTKQVSQLINEQNFSPNLNIMIGHTQQESGRYYEIMDAAQFTYGRFDPKVANTIINLDIAKRDLQNLVLAQFNLSVFRLITDNYLKTFQNSDFSTDLKERNRLRSVVSHLFSDFDIVCPVVLFGSSLVKQPTFFGSVYQYYLSYTNTQSPCYNSTWCTTAHGDDFPLVFGYPFHEPKYSDEDRRISAIVMDIWTSFAKYGYPVFNLDVWPPYTLDPNGEPELNYMELTSNEFMIHQNGYKGNNGFTPNVIHNCLNFWKPILSSE